MYKDKKLYFEIEEFSDLGIKALYTTKDIGDLNYYFRNETTQDKLTENFYKIFNKKNLKIIYAKQTHTNNIIDIDKNTDNYFFEEIDGFITSRKDVALITFYADCLPLYFYDKENQIIGISHSGWQGTFKQIGLETLKLMEKKYNSKRENILIGIGIGISLEKYEVGYEFYEKFKNNFNEDIIKNSFMYCEKSKKYHFDNLEFNRLLFIKNGIKEKNIIFSKECTYKNKRFHSFRRDNSDERNAGVIFFK